MKNKAFLALSDGTLFEGRSFGAEGETGGEVVFNTSMTGYQEILTDPSYHGQIVCMTYPEIGNVGINPEDAESTKPFVKGFVIREYCESPSSWRATLPLHEYMRQHGIVGIQDIDTRSLVRHIRNTGAQEGIVSTITGNSEKLIEKARSSPGLVGLDLVREVTCHDSYDWDEGKWTLGSGFNKRNDLGPQYVVVAYDYGIKLNILRSLVESGFGVKVVPAWTPAEEVLRMNPDGVFLSNGPGDPDAVPYAKEIVSKLIGKIPIFGICLGHQILGLALGGRTFKLKFGHHGANHPVMDLTTGKVEITAQNHGFAVDSDSLKDTAEVTHVNLNDRTVEGLRHRELPLFSVQYHPESSPGPHDASYLFQRFGEMIGDWRH
ncbi:MAG TPA: glutamine-hydrolyzing carbamoyl-phosphate synthase small subunit [Candidatus Binatia bacterium]|jgi:carbamoyl-phosphate synthase small subunit|nr:glutamine-hydrolyzing carbamoyl-phosphate synthase small subunit [Candidatus Binatia bacterium]